MLCGSSRGLLLEMAVQVRGETELAVAEQLGDFCELDPLRQQNRRTGMSKIVEAADG
jgi:hypothetical protein